ncbi:fasciclin domain-containing protein [Leptolyngbya sp. AN02str]|uniref:fasciclin domain-containing protein n=1 Tax=Leptolyngbya sp. AN02str TaxID=3423363 RepID=UPI003D31B9E9
MMDKLLKPQRITLAATVACLLSVGVTVPAWLGSAQVAAQTATPQIRPLAQAPGTIVDVARNNGTFNTLLSAVQAAGLTNTLAGPGPFTVFAPTDDAFALLPQGTVDALLQPQNRDLLTEVLTYHVVPDAVTSDELETGGLDTLNGGLAVLVTPDRVIVNDASVILPDVPASNGVIHAINRVLLPIGLVDELQARTAAAPAATPSPSPSPSPVPGLW